jgi:AcrR family transcriptional regulator
VNAKRTAKSSKANPALAEKPMRADALRNREKLVEAAGKAFAEYGIETSLEEIAARAQVGIGTLYRHFPTREHLVEVVYGHEVEALCRAAEDLARKYPPDKALAAWMQRFVDYIAAKRGMANSLKLLIASNSDLFAATSGKIPAALQQLVDTAIAQGAIRSDIDSSDVLHALSGIYSLPQTPDWRERSRRLITLLMDGLKAGARTASLS